MICPTQVVRGTPKVLPATEQYWDAKFLVDFSEPPSVSSIVASSDTIVVQPPDRMARYQERSKNVDVVVVAVAGVDRMPTIGCTHPTLPVVSSIPLEIGRPVVELWHPSLPVRVPMPLEQRDGLVVPMMMMMTASSPALLWPFFFHSSSYFVCQTNNTMNK